MQGAMFENASFPFFHIAQIAVGVVGIIPNNVVIFQASHFREWCKGGTIVC